MTEILEMNDADGVIEAFCKDACKHFRKPNYCRTYDTSVNPTKARFCRRFSPL
jgi:hypothetical protein